MDYLIDERIELIETISKQILTVNTEYIQSINSLLLKQLILSDEVEEPKIIFSTVGEMKKANLNEGDIVYTKGYYNEDDGGGACYIIKDYNYYLNEWLPEDCRKVGIKPTMTDVYLIDTPVDEYGNHTLDNKLVACLMNKEDIKVEQYGAKGDGNFDNIESFIHLFAHMKHGKIAFKKDGIYLMGQRKQENIPRIYSYLDNPYRAYMSGRGAYIQKPIMANVDGVEIVGENSTIKIKDNDFCNNGKTTDMAILHLFRFVKNLKIHGINFNNNGLTMDSSHVVSNHGIIYKSGNSTLDGGKIAPYSEIKDEISNIEIYDCKFIEGGTRRDVQDVGGDGILIINPSELSHDINIHDNKFINWGRWCFAIDLGGNGECIENVKFNNNYCFQDMNQNTSLYGGCRGLGWIDLEAKKCFKNLEICNNYVDGWCGFAFNGAGKVSENVTIKSNVMTHTTSNSIGSKGYNYTWNFYGVQMKNLVFENNDFSNAAGSYRFGYTLNNIVIRNNKMPSTTDAFSLNGMYGDIIIEGNQRIDYGKICGVLPTQLGSPDYLSDEEKSNPYVNLVFRNNQASISGKFFDEGNKGKYNYIKLTIENNQMNGVNIEAFDAEDFNFDLTQIRDIESISAFSVRGAQFTSPTTINYRGMPNGGGYYTKGDIVAENDKKKIICTEDGYVPMQGSFGLADSDVEFSSITNPKAIIKKGTYVYTDSSLYIVSKEGAFKGDNVPTHTSGYQKCGDAELLYLMKLAKVEIINK
ncbi:hypothetical protein [Clostridium cuniculi]|uniref:hypothetical protein n=1 Tax=Clostridium cuniculi TaxID=2548455 RepID=UPI0010562389|nr:hypothetical protein [Clostridium cuniculi]